jgi:type II secretory pathway component PulF
MFGFSQRVSARQLAVLCRRLGTALEAGIDLRRALTSEVERAGGRVASRLELARRGTAAGDSLSDALAATGDFFPPIFHQMLRVGEETGHLPEVLQKLADHYDHQVALRRSFLMRITWPMFQLAAAVAVIGLAIFVMGIVEQMTGQRTDILGWGLVGGHGAAIYFGIVGAAAVVVYLIVRGLARGAPWLQPLRALLVRLPVLGPALRTLDLSRLAWTLQLALESGMPLRRAVSLALDSTRTGLFTAEADRIPRAIGSGQPLHAALAERRDFPPEFVAAIEVGETSGRLVEQMEIVSRQYEEQARAALATLTTLAGLAVWGVVALLIVVLIFRLFSFYLGTINQALQL